MYFSSRKVFGVSWSTHIYLSIYLCIDMFHRMVSFRLLVGSEHLFYLRFVIVQVHNVGL